MTELIRRLDRARFKVHVACFHSGARGCRASPSARVGRRVSDPGVRPRRRRVAQMLAFARWCRRERIAVVQTCDLYANIFGLPGAALAGVPVRIGSRRELNPDKIARPDPAAAPRLSLRATKVVANSRAARQMLEAEGLAPGSIAVIPNGVDLGVASSAPERRRPVRTIITVANLRAEKSHETLLARGGAARRRASRRCGFSIVGDGPRRAELEQLAAPSASAAHVEFLGHREDVPALLAAADVFVLPSRSEAFPNGAIEAMAAGLPVVACAVGGLLDLDRATAAPACSSRRAIRTRSPRRSRR